MKLSELIAWLNKTYSTRNWDQRCQQLMWNVIWWLTGDYKTGSEARMRPYKGGYYPTAQAAREHSGKLNTDASKAPAGAFHWWRNPAGEGHVAYDVAGGGRVVLMTGTTATGTRQLGKNYGLNSVAGYTAAKNNPYLGWTRKNGAYPDVTGVKLVDDISSAQVDPQTIIDDYLENAGDLVKAASTAGLDLAVASALIEKESNGANVFGHDRGGAYYGGGAVTEAKYKDFIKQVRAGKTSNGVGPAQITWPGFFDEMEAAGLKPWRPLDNMRYGFGLMANYLGGSLSDAAIKNAGKRYNGNASYGVDLLDKVRKWRLRLAGASRSSSSTAAASARKSWQASAFDLGTDATPAQWRMIQQWLKRLGRYNGPADGIPGQETWRGIQRTVAKYGFYRGAVDGVPGPNTAKGMQAYAKAAGKYSGPVDGKLGPRSWAGFVKRLSA